VDFGQKRGTEANPTLREMLGGADGKGDSVEYGTASRRTRDKVGMWTTRRRPLGLGRQLACRARHYGEQALDGNGYAQSGCRMGFEI
jgi:hypothetical protein